MSTATVTGVEQDAGGNPLPGVVVSASLRRAHPPEAAFGSSGGEIVSSQPPVSTTSADDGTWALALERTDTMTPSGQVYEIARVLNGVLQPPVCITVPEGGGAVYQLISEAP